MVSQRVSYRSTAQPHFRLQKLEAWQCKEAAPASGFGNQQGWSGEPQDGGERPTPGWCTDDLCTWDPEQRYLQELGLGLPEGRGESPGEAGVGCVAQWWDKDTEGNPAPTAK